MVLQSVLRRLIRAARRALVPAVMAAAMTGAAAADDPFEQTWTEVADGVWTGIRADSPRFPVMGNTVIVIGGSGVLLFDGAGFALQGERVAAKVKSLTGRPVTHIVISHWHGDHHFGNHEILKAFPHAEIISHSFTKAAMASRLVNYIEPYRKDGARPLVEQLTKSLESGKREDGTPLPEAAKAYYRQILADAEILDTDLRRLRVTAPTRTFEDRLTIDLGGRIVELRHFGHGNTKGDAVLYLPAEKIVATGDMVVRPTPYGFGSYPRSWAATLKTLKTLEFKLLIPGHGDPQTDTAYVDLLIETLESVANQVEPLAKQGLDFEAARKRVDFSSVEERFTGGDPKLAFLFDIWFKTPIVRSAWNVATGVGNELLEEPKKEESAKDKPKTKD